MTDPMSRVHVVTVMYNSAATMEEWAEGVLDQGGVVGAVTVIDNGSSDGSVVVARTVLARFACATRLVEQGNKGFAGGYAAAVQSRSDGLAVLCVNPDVRLAPEAVLDMLSVLHADARAGVITAPLVDLDGRTDTATRRRLPTLGGSALYSVLGHRTPARWRYNSRPDSPSKIVAGRTVSTVEATTGALMLLRRDFRDITVPAFDTDYWMYGEDLQLCADAARSGLDVLVVERAPSLHIKGASSGRPRSLRSNVAFHRAMWTYARKNLLPASSPAAAGVGAAIVLRLLLDEVRNQPLKVRRRLTARVEADDRSGVLA